MPAPTRAQSPVACDPAAADVDADGLSEECEFALAAQHAPRLKVSPASCNWGETQGRLQGGYLFAVHPQADTIRLVYMPAYYEDWGSTSGPGDEVHLRAPGSAEPCS